MSAFHKFAKPQGRSSSKLAKTAVALCALVIAGVAYADQTDAEYSLTIDRNTFFDDSVTVASDIPASSNGKYVSGTTITLTAVPGTTGTFKRWYGDVAKTNQTAASFSFKITADTWIYARFVHPWTLSADKTTATDGNFIVNCSVSSEANHTLTLGKKSSYGLLVTEKVDNGDGSVSTNFTGSGIIDVGGPIYLEGDATPWKFTALAAAGGAMSVPLSAAGIVTGFISPGTITSNGSQLFHCGDNPNRYGSSYNMIIVDEPNATTFITSYLFSGQLNVERLILELPLLTKWTSDKVWVTMSAAKTKFDWWNLSSLSSMKETAFYWQWASSGCEYRARRFGAKGELKLPSMRGLTFTESLGTQLKLLQNVEAISLGGKDEATTVTNLCYNAFAGDSSLKKLTLHADANMQVGEDIFGDSAKDYSAALSVKGRVPDEIHFTGEAISQAAIDNLLADAVAAETKPVKIYASRYQRGWGGSNEPVSWIDRNVANLTVADRELANGEQIIGVYRGGAEAPLGKALILHSENEWDKKSGMVIYIY